MSALFGNYCSLAICILFYKLLADSTFGLEVGTGQSCSDFTLSSLHCERLHSRSFQLEICDIKLVERKIGLKEQFQQQLFNESLTNSL